MNTLQNESSFYFDENLFIEMEEMANMGMYETDLEKGIFKASPRFQKMFHLPPQKHYPVAILQSLIHFEDIGWVMELFANCIEQHTAFKCEYRCLIDGKVIYIRSRSTISYDQEGKAVKVLGIKQDITEQKQVQEALRLSEDRAKSIVDSITDGLITLDREWRITYINPRAGDAVRPMHLAAGELIGKNFWEVFPGQEETILEQNYRRAMQEQKTLAFEAYYPMLESWFDVRVYPSGDGISIYFLDITERKRTEDALRKSEQIARSRLDELEAIYDTAPVGLSVLDTELRFVRINKHLAEMNGYSVAHHLGKTVREIVPALAEEVEPVLRQIIETGEPVLNIELTGETPAQPGVERTWVENWFPFKNNQAEVIGINIVAQEITELKQAEAASRESEERYRRLFNSLDDGFCVCQMLVDENNKPYDYRFVEVNHTFEAHSGLKEATGKTALELVPNLERHWIETYAKAGIGGEFIRFEQGSQAMGRWFDVYVLPFGRPQSRLFAIQFKDISERKQREVELQRYREELALINKELAAANEELITTNEELSKTNNQLMQVNNDLDNFVYIASHDLKAPIANIFGLLRLLKGKLPSDTLALSGTQKTLSLIDESVDRFMKTITNMSDIASLQKQANLPIETINLTEIIEEVRMDMALAIEQSEAEFFIEADECSPIQFSHKNLRSVVYNLLSNAVKYRHPHRKPEIRIRCQPAEGYHLLTVADNGLGMNLSQDNRLFSMFQRLHDHVEGTGVGLYIVKKILENAGGKIEVESKVGEGTTFKVFIKMLI